MSLSAYTRRRLGLSFVSRRVRSGNYTPADLERWAGELGPVVYELAGSPAPDVSNLDTPDSPDPSPSPEDLTDE